MHAALEFLYKQRTNLKTPLLDQLLQWYFMTFSNECASSATEFIPEEQDTFRARGKVYLERYRANYYPFDQEITMAVEESFSFYLNDQISFSGYIDRLDVHGDTLTIIDYKTSKKLEPDDADTHQEQITLYAAGLQQKYGKKFTTFVGKLIYLHLQKEVTWTISSTDMQQIREYYLQNAELIQDAKQRLEVHPHDDTIFPARVGSHCSFCPFQMICPKRKHQFMDDEIVSSELGEKTIK